MISLPPSFSTQGLAEKTKILRINNYFIGALLKKLQKNKNGSREDSKRKDRSKRKMS